MATAANSPEKVVIRGWITPLLEHVVTFLTIPSGLLIGHRRSAQGTEDLHRTAGQARRADTFVAICLAIGASGYVSVQSQYSNWWLWLPRLAVAYACWRIVDIAAAAIRMTLFDPMYAQKRQAPGVASHVRIIVLGLCNYLELFILFGAIYSYWHSSMRFPEKGWDSFSGLYFSCMTQLTVGYGDIYPSGALRMVACLQSLAGLMLLSVIVLRFLALLRPVRSVEEDAADVAICGASSVVAQDHFSIAGTQGGTQDGHKGL